MKTIAFRVFLSMLFIYFFIATSVGPIRRMVDYSSVTVYKDGRSLSFSNNRIFSLNLTFLTVSQYPHICLNILMLNKLTDLS